MTAALNYRLQLLLESGTCEPLLLQVVSLLVAHANDTTQLKASCGDVAPPPMKSSEVRAVTPAPLPPCSSSTAGNTLSIETMRIAQEHIVCATEASLQRYGSDVRRVNDLAVAALEKEAMLLQERVGGEMDATLSAAAAQAATRIGAEVERRHQNWLESGAEEVRLLEARFAAHRREFQEHVAHLEAYGDFLFGAHSALLSAGLLSAHQLTATSMMLEGELDHLVANSISKAEFEVLKQRVLALERGEWPEDTGEEAINPPFRDSLSGVPRGEPGLEREKEGPLLGGDAVNTSLAEEEEVRNLTRIRLLRRL